MMLYRNTNVCIELQKILQRSNVFNAATIIGTISLDIFLHGEGERIVYFPRSCRTILIAEYNSVLAYSAIFS